MTVGLWKIYSTGTNNWNGAVAKMYMMYSVAWIVQIFFTENHSIDLNFVRSTLHEVYCSNWKNTVTCVPKLRTCILYKNQYLTEPYVECDVNRAHRSALAKFRCGILPLSVETGRFNAIPLEFRLCVFCDDNVVEDEYHFFFSCNLNNDLRSSLFDYLRQDVPDFDTLDLNDNMIYLMSRNAIKKLLNLYVFRAMEMRRRVLYKNDWALCCNNIPI